MQRLRKYQEFAARCLREARQQPILVSKRFWPKRRSLRSVRLRGTGRTFARPVQVRRAATHRLERGNSK
jgi:hypothetical protein